MRDAVELATDVYLPAGGEPRPALVQRTPYGKCIELIVSLTFAPHDAVERGYAVIVQDCRGCGSSDGEFHAFVDERPDGHDTIEWVAAQPWCDGRVGIYGSSYMGATVLQAAVDAPASLQAAMAYLTGPNFYDGWVYTGGALELGNGLRWTLDMADRIANWHNPPGADAVRAHVARFRADQLAFLRSGGELRTLPGPAELPHWQEWLDHPEYDDYWRSLDVVAAAREGRLRVPLLQVAAWYDPFARSQLALYEALDGEQRLVVGPWDHNAYLSPGTNTTAGTRDFGPRAASGRAGVGPLALDWFDHWFAGAEDGLPPIRYFAIGPDEWRDADTWPPPHEPQSWYLHTGGKLSMAPPPEKSADSFSYEPESQAPTLGGRHVLGFVPSGVQDQRGIAEREDVLVYRSDPLAEPLTIAGPVRLELQLESTAATVDVVATLADVAPSGEVGNVADGILRFEPNGGGAVTVELGHTAYEFAAGHRLGLHVTGSSFPRFEPRPKPSTQRVLHGSALVLPVSTAA